MDYVQDLHELCETLGEAVKEANEKIRQAGGKLTGDDVGYVDKLTHALKSIKAVIAMSGDEDEYSNDDGASYWYPTRSHNMSNRSHRRYSRSREFSRNNTLADQLRDLLQDAPDDKTRQEIKRLIERLD